MQNPKSEQEVRKQTEQLTAPAQSGGASKFSPAYWLPRLFRPTYTRDGQRLEVAEWYCQIQSGGRREKLALATNTKEEAARVAARLFKTISAKGWQAALEELLPGKAERSQSAGSPTVGEFLVEVKEKASLKPATFNNYAVCLRWIVGRALNVKADASRFDYVSGGHAAWKQRIEGKRLEDLTPDLVEAALAHHVKRFAGNPLKQQRAKRSAASFARQARSLFAPDVLKLLSFANVPNPFAGLKVEGARPSRYVSQIDAGELLRQGREELAETDGESYKALLLALGAGLRKSEIDNLQWQQIDGTKGVIRVMTTEAHATKTEDSQGAVYVDAGLIAELLRHRDSESASLYVLTGNRQPKPEAVRADYRAEATFERLTAWLRGKGITTPKPLHDLRREFGSIIAATSDIFTASRQLRHSNIATTAAYYLDTRRRVAPAIGDMLNPKPADETKATKKG